MHTFRPDKFIVDLKGLKQRLKTHLGLVIAGHYQVSFSGKLRTKTVHYHLYSVYAKMVQENCKIKKCLEDP